MPLPVHDLPGAAASRLAGSLQGVCARRPGQGFACPYPRVPGGEHSWSLSYCAASCGAAPPAVIKKDIASIEKRFLPGVNARGSSLNSAEPTEPDAMASELAQALASRGLVLVSAEYLEELEDAADSATIEARADEKTVPFRPEDHE